MKTINQVRIQLKNGQFEFSRHAFKRAVERNIAEAEIRQAAKNLKLI